jgi:plastocyanin
MRMGRIILVTGLAAALVSAPAPSGGATSTIKAKGSPGSFRWDPTFRHITKGDRIKWKNTTETTHHVVAYGGGWNIDRSIAPGEATKKKFKNTGTYNFRCDIVGHSTLNGGDCEGMCGEIHVAN